jgi:hypothetical protein
MTLKLDYTKTLIEDRGVVVVTVFDNGKIFFEIECFADSPYSIEEEIQNWLDDNGYEDEDFVFLLIK